MPRLKVDRYTQRDMGVMLQIFMDAHRWRGVYDNTKDHPNPNMHTLGAGFSSHNDAKKELAKIEKRMCEKLPILTEMLRIK